MPYPDKQIFYDKVPAFRDDPYSIMTSRGCPFTCTYCCNDIFKTLYKGQKLVRRRSVDNVIGELKFAKKKFNIKEVFFQDEVFSFDLSWLEDFSKKYKQEINLPFQILFHFKFATEKKVQLLKTAGCYRVTFGMQSTSERIRRDVCNRHHTNEQAMNAVNLFKKSGCDVFIEHILGLPFETLDELSEAVELYREMAPYVIYTYWLTYYPATSIIQKGKEAGLLSDADIKEIYKGNGSYYHKGTAIKDRNMLLRYQTLFDLIPFLSKKNHLWLTSQKTLLKYLPRGFISHFSLLLLVGLKSGDLQFIRKIKLALSKKSVP